MSVQDRSDRLTSDWRERGRCRDEDPDLFFPIGTGGPSVAQSQQAVLVCRRCPVAQVCLEWALEHHQDAGVWGAKTEEQRRRMLRVREGRSRGPRR